MKKFLFALAAVLFFLAPATAQAAPPSYGSGEREQTEKETQLEQIRQTVQALQPLTDETAARIAGHNVRVRNYSDADSMGLIYVSEGSGVVMAVDGNMAYIVSAAHCLRRAHTVVQFADGAEYEAFLAYLNPEKDVGFLLVPCAQLAPETRAAILPAAGADAAQIGKKQGEPLCIVNSVLSPNGQVVGGVLDSFSVVYPNNPNQRVLQFLSTVSYGSSGGGVYSQEGVWVGIVSGGDTYGVCWAVPYGDILSEFQAWLAGLAQQAAVAA